MPDDQISLIRKITLTNFLSFGPGGTEVTLKPLNVLIGPNGSGKSNFFQALRFLKTCEYGLEGFVEEESTGEEYIWQGTRSQESFHLEVEIAAWPSRRAVEGEAGSLSHRISASGIYFSKRLMVDAESVWVLQGDCEELCLYLHNKGEGSSQIRKDITVQNPDGTERTEDRLVQLEKSNNDSILLHRDSSDFLGPLRRAYRRIFIFGGIGMQNSSEVRRAQSTNLDQSFLAPDGSNLANVVEALQHHPAIMAEIVLYLKRFYPKAIRLVPGLVGNRVRLFIEEEGLAKTTPASRLSSGTIAFITLAVMLLHPSPPPLICLEQPEDGLHPDALPLIAEMLVKASKRTQVIVATHSEVLVSSLSDHPDSILVFEPGPEGSTVRRLDGEELKPWLEKYSLGDLWANGEIGGVRR